MSLILLSQSEVKARVAKLVLTAAEVQSEIHLIGCSTLDHTRVHGDYTGAVALLNGLPKGQRVKALAYWFRHFSNGKMVAKINSDTKLWDIELKKDRTDADFRVDEAIEITFADLTAEKDPTTLELDKFLKGLDRTANNTENFDGTNIPKVAAETRAMAARIVAFVRESKQAA